MRSSLSLYDLPLQSSNCRQFFVVTDTEIMLFTRTNIVTDDRNNINVNFYEQEHSDKRLIKLRFVDCDT